MNPLQPQAPLGQSPMGQTQMPLGKSKKAPTMRGFLDIDTMRDSIFKNVVDGVNSRYPIEYDKNPYRLEVHNPRFEDNKHFSLADQKQAILDRKTLDWKLKGTWKLTDKRTGEVLSQADKVIARVPYLTHRGTFIYNGNEYTVANQQRLRPGVYARIKDNGELESHINLIPGTGSSFRIHMEPESSKFRMQIGQSKVPIYPILKALGASDADIINSWGPQIYQRNVDKEDPFVLKKVFDRLSTSKIKQDFASDITGGLRQVFSQMKIDPEISERNLGVAHDTVTKDALLRAAQKLLHIHQNKEEPDDRDSQANQTIHSAEDLFRERIEKDAGQIGRKLLWKASYSRRVDNFPSSALSPQLTAVLLNSGLGQALTEINPIDVTDQLVRVSRLGEGAMSGTQGVPDEARNVQPSQLGFVDPIRAPESAKIGVDARLTIGTLKGSDGQLYSQMWDAKTKKVRPVSAREAVHAVLAFPGEMNDPTKMKVRAMVGGKIRFVDRNEVNFAIPEPEHMFTIGSNLVPGISGIKGGRLLMAAKMVNQALPLREREAPLVQTAVPDGDPDQSYEKKYAAQLGVVKATDAGRVMEVTPDGIKVRTRNGTKTHELYNHFPFNQKTYLHNEPLVKPGDFVQPNQILATSNYTDTRMAH
jgi:DNA-directed RNA polymerase beta subunit